MQAITMNISFFLIIACCQASTEVQDYMSVFKSLLSQGDFLWPTPDSAVDSIASTFGPRLKLGSMSYDFHRGIDIMGAVGDPVVAPYSGTVFYARNFDDGGLVMALKHELPEPIQISPDHPPTTTFYTLYFHLSEFNAQIDDVVTTGQIIAKVGRTGGASFPHLHLEIRIGTSCSLEFAVQNPTSKCNILGYDPHVHPLLLSKTAPSIVEVKLLKRISTLEEKVVRVRTLKSYPGINSYIVSIVNWKTGAIRMTHELDLNRRVGFNATSSVLLDTQDKEKPYLSPVAFNRDPEYWTTELRIPRVWLGKKPPRFEVQVTVVDIWGESTTIAFGKKRRWK